MAVVPGKEHVARLYASQDDVDDSVVQSLADLANLPLAGRMVPRA